MNSPDPASRARLRRLPERGAYDAAQVYAVLDAAFLAHVGFATAGQPFVIPTLYGREDDTLFLHGSAASRTLRELAAGLPACVNVALVDGLVLARSGFNSSLNYRSVVAFGTARLLPDAAEKEHALEVISEHLLAGRWREIRPPSERELKATAVLSFRIEDASAKIRTGPPKDDEADYALPVWAGVVPLHLARGEPQPDPRLAPTLLPPSYLRCPGK